VLKVTDPEAPVLRLPVLNEPSSAVAVWGTVSLFVQVTLSPTFTATFAGAKAKPWILTAASAA